MIMGAAGLVGLPCRDECLQPGRGSAIAFQAREHSCLIRIRCERAGPEICGTQKIHPKNGAPVGLCSHPRLACSVSDERLAPYVIPLRVEPGNEDVSWRERHS